jgi:hypothetical protein
LAFFQENFRIFQAILQRISVFEYAVCVLTSKAFLCKIFASSGCIDLGLFFVFSKKNLNFKNSSMQVQATKSQLSKHVHTKLELSNFYPDGLQIFLSKFQNLPILNKIRNRSSQKAFFIKI